MKQAVIQDRLEELLRENPDWRNLNPNQLYKKFIKHHYPEESFEKVYDNFELYGMPPIESLPRARRRLVEKYPELAGSDEVEEKRKENEQEYYLFYGRRSFWK